MIKVDSGEILALNGSRISLRAFDMSQISERYLSWLTNPIVNQYSRRANSVRATRLQAAEYLSTRAKDEVIYGIHDPDCGHVGNIKYGPVDWTNRRADISILVGESSVWGRGVGTEAVYLVCRHLFEDFSLHRVDAGTRNPAFVRLVQKLGWKVEGVLRERIISADRFHDQILVAQLASEFVRRPEYDI